MVNHPETGLRPGRVPALGNVLSFSGYEAGSCRPPARKSALLNDPVVHGLIPVHPGVVWGCWMRRPAGAGSEGCSRKRARTTMKGATR